MLRDILIKDFGWKLFSLLLAGFIWFTVHKIIEEPSSYGGPAAVGTVTYDEIPVLIVATAADMHLYHVNPDKVSVTVSGPPSVTSGLQANEVRVIVDLSKFDAAKNLFQNLDVSLPNGVTLVRVKPTRVSVVAPPKM